MLVHTKIIDIRLSAHTKNAIGWVLLPAAVLLGTVAIARATLDTSWIAAGKTVSASSLTTDLTQLDARLSALEDGGAGSQGATGAVVWRDSTGAVVPVVRILGDPGQGSSTINIEFIDSATGAVWTYLPFQASPVGPSGALIGYPTGDCTGTAFVAWATPRYAMSVPGKTGYYVVPDGALPTQTAVLSFQSGSAQCQSGGLSIMAVPFSTLLPIAGPPAPPGKPPYHAAAQ